MKIVITDVSVFFDLYKLQVLPEFFSLDWEIHTTNFVYNEILREEQVVEFESFVKDKKLNIIKINIEEEAEIQNMQLKRPNKSFPDKTVLWKAKKEKCTLLTCDKVLRTEASFHKIEVHGTAWIILQFVENGIIDKMRAIELLEQLVKDNVRQPVEQIKKIIDGLK
ncbi:MAG: hypothetical protein PHS59_12530 [Paludibacter sp.]|nr:hypothetical protein [Paludibacter sp.]